MPVVTSCVITAEPVKGKSSYNETPENKLSILLNIYSSEVSSTMSTDIKDSIEFQSRRLCGALHVKRFRILQVYAKKQ